MVDAKRAGRIVVWPTEEIAKQADTADSKYVRRLVVWRTIDDAIAHTHLDDESGGDVAASLKFNDGNNSQYIGQVI